MTDQPKQRARPLKKLPLFDGHPDAVYILQKIMCRDRYPFETRDRLERYLGRIIRDREDVIRQISEQNQAITESNAELVQSRQNQEEQKSSG